MRAAIWTAPITGGGPEDMRLIEVELAPPGASEVLVRHQAIGVNFMDVYFRSGAYPNPSGRLGAEAAGIVEAVGDGVTGFAPGDRVAYATGPNGAYADRRIVDSRHLVHLPDDADAATAAAVLMKGMTAAMLAGFAQALDRVLVHAAAGGVGLMLGQWLREPIGVVGDAAKRERALAHGYAQVIVGDPSPLAGGIDLVFDGIGRDSFETSLALLAPRGRLIAFGSASGPVPPFSIARLAPKGLTISRPSLTPFTATRGQLDTLAAEVLARLQAGTLRVAPTRYRFADLPQAHRDLEARRSSGSLIAEL